MKSLPVTENDGSGANNSMEEIYIKEEKLQADLVSEFYNKAFYKFIVHEINTMCF